MRYVISLGVMLFLMAVPALAYTEDIEMTEGIVSVPQYNGRAINIEISDWKNDSAKIRFDDEYTGFLKEGESYTTRYGDIFKLNNFTEEYYETIISVKGVQESEFNIWQGLFSEGERKEAETAEGDYRIEVEDIEENQALVSVGSKNVKLRVGERASLGDKKILSLDYISDSQNTTSISINRLYQHEKSIYFGNVKEGFHLYSIDDDQNHSISVERITEDGLQMEIDGEFWSIKNSSKENRTGIEVSVGNIIRQRASAKAKITFNEKVGVDLSSDKIELADEEIFVGERFKIRGDFSNIGTISSSQVSASLSISPKGEGGRNIPLESLDKGKKGYIEEIFTVSEPGEYTITLFTQSTDGYVKDINPNNDRLEKSIEIGYRKGSLEENTIFKEGVPVEIDKTVFDVYFVEKDYIDLNIKRDSYDSYVRLTEGQKKQNGGYIIDVFSISEEGDFVTLFISKDNDKKQKDIADDGRGDLQDNGSNGSAFLEEEPICSENSDCDDGDDCTVDKCLFDGSACDHIKIPNCEEKQQSEENVFSRIFSWFRRLF